MDPTPDTDTIQSSHSAMSATEDSPWMQSDAFIEPPKDTEPPSRPPTYSEVVKMNMDNSPDDSGSFPNQFEKDEVGPIFATPGEASAAGGEQLQPEVNLGEDQLIQKGSLNTEFQLPVMEDERQEEVGPETKESNEMDAKGDDNQASPETAELQQVSLEEGEFGYNPGRESDPGEDTGENPEASRTRRRLSHSEPPHHSAPRQPTSSMETPAPDSVKLTAETAELRNISLKKGEFGYNPGKEGEPGEDTGENPKASRTRRRLSHSQPPHHGAPKPPAPSKQTPKTGSAEGTAETTELRRVSLTQSEFGYNPGKEGDPGEDTGENPEASRTRRRLSHSEPPHHSAPKPLVSSVETLTVNSIKLTAETAELRRISLKKGEFGYNPGKEGEPGEDTGENPKASRTRRRLSHSQPPHHGAPKPPAPSKQTPKTASAEGTAETTELRRVSLTQSEFGYNPGIDSEPGEETGENPEAARTRRRFSHSEPPHHSVLRQSASSNQGKEAERHPREPGEHPRVKHGYPEAEELSHIDARGGDFGYSVGNGSNLGEDPRVSQARGRLGSDRSRHSAKSSHALETQGLRYIHAGKHDTGPQQTQASPETRELRNIGLRSSEFGYNVGRGEEAGRIRFDGDGFENPGATRARHRASIQSDGDYGEEKPSIGYRNPPRPRRSSQELGIESAIHEQPRITPSSRENVRRSELDTLVNNTLQSYLQDFLADRGSHSAGGSSEFPKVQSSQLMERVPGQLGLGNDRATLGDEHRPKVQVTTGVQQSTVPSSDGAIPVTAEQLGQVLRQFKRDILDSINSRPTQDSDSDEIHLSGSISRLGPRLGRIEKDIDFIRKQISTSTADAADGVRSQELVNGALNSGIAARSTVASTYRRGKSNINWVVFGLGIMAALSLFALGEMFGSAKHTGKGMSYRLAEWLLNEGRGQKVSGKLV